MRPTGCHDVGSWTGNPCVPMRLLIDRQRTTAAGAGPCAACMDQPIWAQSLGARRRVARETTNNQHNDRQLVDKAPAQLLLLKVDSATPPLPDLNKSAIPCNLFSAVPLRIPSSLTPPNGFWLQLRSSRASGIDSLLTVLLFRSEASLCKAPSARQTRPQ